MILTANLDKLGYKTNYFYSRINISWKDAGTLITEYEEEVSA